MTLERRQDYVWVSAGLRLGFQGRVVVDGEGNGDDFYDSACDRQNEEENEELKCANEDLPA